MDDLGEDFKELVCAACMSFNCLGVRMDARPLLPHVDLYPRTLTSDVEQLTKIWMSHVQYIDLTGSTAPQPFKAIRGPRPADGLEDSTDASRAASMLPSSVSLHEERC